MRLRSFALLGVVGALAGCEFITSLDGLGPADGQAADVTAPDAFDGAPIDAVAAPESGPDAEAGTSDLVANGGFESAAAVGCGSNWGPGYGSSYTQVAPGRSGSYACEVCVQGSQTSYQMNAIATVPVQPGSYAAQAYFTTPDGGVAVTPGAGLQIYYTGDGGVSGCTGDSTYCQAYFQPPPVGSWYASSTVFTVTGSGTLSIDVHGYGGTPNSCFVVDDVTLVQQ